MYVQELSLVQTQALAAAAAECVKQLLVSSCCCLRSWIELFVDSAEHRLSQRHVTDIDVKFTYLTNKDSEDDSRRIQVFLCE